MKRVSKLVLIILTAILTIAFLTMVAVCVTMKVKYWGTIMGNEAYGFFSAALMITFLIGILTAVLWTILLKQKKRKTTLV